MRYYSELYKIGVLVIGMSDELFNKYILGKVKDLKGYDEIEITELFSAQYSPVQAKFQKEFFAAIEITEESHYYKWERTLDEN